MPWKVGSKTKKGWPIKRADTGEVVGYSSTRGKAAASVRARYANTKEKSIRMGKDHYKAR